VESEALYREALATSTVVFGARHKLTLVCVNNLGCLLQAKGALAEAAEHLREGLHGSREVLGDAHLDTLISSSNLGALLRRQGEAEEANSLIRDAFEGVAKARKVLGAANPSVAFVADGLREIRREPAFALLPPPKGKGAAAAPVEAEEEELDEEEEEMRLDEVAEADLKAMLRPIFAEFDKDGSGSVDADEMRRILAAAKIAMSDEQLQAMMAAADLDGGGTVDFDEFVRVVSEQLASGTPAAGGLAAIVTQASDAFGWLNPLNWFRSDAAEANTVAAAPAPAAAPLGTGAATPPTAAVKPSPPPETAASASRTIIPASAPPPAIAAQAIDAAPAHAPGNAKAHAPAPPVAPAAAAASFSAPIAAASASLAPAPKRPPALAIGVPSLNIRTLPKSEEAEEDERLAMAADMVTAMTAEELAEQLAERGIDNVGSRVKLAERMLAYLLGESVPREGGDSEVGRLGAASPTEVETRVVEDPRPGEGAAAAA